MSNIFKYFIFVFNFLISVGRILKYKTYKGGLKYSNKINSGTLNILATGPSLKKDLADNLEFIKKSDLLVVNDFAFDESFIQIKPSYYVFADPGYWLDKELTTKENISIREKIFNLIIKTTTWKLDIYVPKTSGNFFIELFRVNSCISVQTYNSIDIGNLEDIWVQFCLKYNLAAPCYNVVGTSIYLGINMGFKIINIYGADHSWTQDLTVDNHNRVCTISRHFYDEVNQTNLKSWQKVNNQNYKMHEILTDLAKTFHYYFIINNYAKSKGAKVYNYTFNSFIDAFSRKKINNDKNY